MPKFHPTGLTQVRSYLSKKQMLRELDRDEKIPVMSSNCPSLDWITDCGGIPRGRVVVVVGPESSGKCVDLNTFIPVHGRGIVKMQDLANELGWVTVNGEVQADQHAELGIYVPDAHSNPVQTNAMYFAGSLESHRVMTEDGNELVGSKSHRLLVLTDRGILSWTMLRDMRLGDVLVKTVGQKVSGSSDKIFQWSLPKDDEELTLQKASTASFFGAVCGAENRDGSIYILVTNPSQIRMIRTWAREMVGDPEVNPFDEDVAEFSRFSGMARVKDGRWAELVTKAISVVPGIIRTSSLTAQAHWCAGLTLTRGVWTQNDLEMEIESQDVARTLHMVLENLGIRTIIYTSVDTFSRDRYKLALRDRLAQQEAQNTIWRGYTFSPDWRGESVIDQVETHEYLRQTLERAREALREEGMEEEANGLDVEDLEKDNLDRVAGILFPLSRKKKSFDRVYQTLHLLASPCTYLDRVTFSKATGVEVPMADLSVPIGSLYSTGGLISHNSTLAMHLSNQELSTNPSSVVVFQDYEHSMAVPYARKMGLHKHGERFLLIPSNEFEEADDLVKMFETQKVFPSLWIIDSIPAMVPKAAFERESDENPQVALQARMFSDLLARWVKFAAKYGVTFVLLNQLRAKIAMGYGDKGKSVSGIPGSDKESQAGGFAVRFYSSLTIDLRPSKVIKANVFNPMLGEREEIPIANMVKMTVRKNKCGAPYRSAMAYIQFGEGIDTVRTIVDLAVTQRVVNVRSKSFYELTLPDSRFMSINGKENFIQALKDPDPFGQGKFALDALKSMLQWDKADEVHAQILGLTEENVETGEEKPAEGEVEGVVSEGLLELLLTRESVIEQADVLNLLTRRGKTTYWTNPETGKEYRGLRPDLLEKNMDEEGLEAMGRIVLGRINEIEAQLNAQEGSNGAVPEAVEGPQGTGGVEGAAPATGSTDGQPGGQDDPLSSIFGGEGTEGTGVVEEEIT
jgi:recombination protein RecA